MKSPKKKRLFDFDPPKALLEKRFSELDPPKFPLKRGTYQYQFS